MGQCVIKDCGFNVQKLKDQDRKNLNDFLKEVLLSHMFLSNTFCLENQGKVLNS